MFHIGRYCVFTLCGRCVALYMLYMYVVFVAGHMDIKSKACYFVSNLGYQPWARKGFLQMYVHLALEHEFTISVS